MSWPIVYEDEYLAAFDKPSGLLVVPDRWDKERVNLVEWVRDHHSSEWRNAHRLDRDTSGLVLFAKSAEMERALASLFEQHAIRKTYSALVRPAPHRDQGLISMPLDEDPKRLGRMRVSLGGKPSRSEYDVVEAWNGRAVALVEVRPLTGRTHQIRVHLAAIGAPIIADAWYGDGLPLTRADLPRKGRERRDERHARGRREPSRSREEFEPSAPLLERLALHAGELEFEHPVTRVACRITSRWPADFARAVSALRGRG